MAQDFQPNTDRVYVNNEGDIMKNAKKFIEKELKDLNIRPRSEAYRLCHEQALAASELLTKAELKKFIVEYLDILPLSLFDRGDFI